MAPAHLRCQKCGWGHFAVARPEPAPDTCFNCGFVGFDEVPESAIPEGVTIQPIRWPPLIRPPKIPKDQLTAADIATLHRND